MKVFSLQPEMVEIFLALNGHFPNVWFWIYLNPFLIARVFPSQGGLCSLSTEFTGGVRRDRSRLLTHSSAFDHISMDWRAD